MASAHCLLQCISLPIHTENDAQFFSKWRFHTQYFSITAKLCANIVCNLFRFYCSFPCFATYCIKRIQECHFFMCFGFGTLRALTSINNILATTCTVQLSCSVHAATFAKDSFTQSQCRNEPEPHSTYIFQAAALTQQHSHLCTHRVMLQRLEDVVRESQTTHQVTWRSALRFDTVAVTSATLCICRQLLRNNTPGHIVLCCA